ncbi:Gfo/Idh/MocA family protein [Floccifex sp.]|uniref:Gfo/Idh/MocA family protein n=1 Tax=Floccifex sp. TaxID=2815810 RepID=UPI002A74BBBA|nr:Gfo/Idh/MocA family oxidoreductase [Floccifex sp.]MDD7280427.1 Gfo/Idh/MocA family oxidoreductase [Erysipelotrichaceae bacterium]MDY2957571.1 Gfo/Idh/MocA family oxidoreductase [Floccifex sp.]
MKVGTIGTGFIVDRMIESMKLVDGIEVVACYSRSEEKAKAFCEKHEMKRYYSNLDEMMKDEELDTIYVASPNSLHYAQSKKALEAHKHVINEKPFCPTLKESKELFEIAQKNGVYIFEAITNQFLPNYKIIKENLNRVGDIKLIQVNYSQYSSRYDKYKNHEQTNAFDPAFNGGALMDIGVYCLHFVTGLFGKPQSTQYYANIGYNGIDTSGTVVLQYPKFIATCTGAKDSSSDVFAFIQGDKGCLRVKGMSIGILPSVDFIPPKGEPINNKNSQSSLNLGIEQEAHMVYECREFNRIINEKDDETYQKLCDHTNVVVEILEKSIEQVKH